MSTVEPIALFVVSFALAGLLAIALEVLSRANHPREHPHWKPGEPL